MLIATDSLRGRRIVTPLPPTRFRLQLLGAPGVYAAGTSQGKPLLTQPRRLALLAYLTLARTGGLHSRDKLVELLWPDSDQGLGRQALRNALHGIRRALADAVIVTAGKELVGIDPALLECDVVELAPNDAVRALHIELMEGFHVTRAPAFERWLDGERRRFKGAVEGPATHTREGASPSSNSDSDVHVLCVRGTYLFLRAAHGGDLDDLRRSRAFFEQALERESSYAPALAGLSNSLAAGAARDVWPPFHVVFGEAIELSRKALALDPTLAIPHVHFGVKAMYLDDDWEVARREFERAVALDPHYAEARRFLGIYYGTVGRWRDAIAELREAVRLEPQIALFRNSLADAYMAMGDYDAAIAELGAALEQDPRYRAAGERLIRCYERRHRYEEAISERLRSGAGAAGDGFRRAFAARGVPGYRAERAKELRERIAKIEATLASPPSRAGDILVPPELGLALACAELHDWDGVRLWRQRACHERPGRRPWFDSRPELAPAKRAG